MTPVVATKVTDLIVVQNGVSSIELVRRRDAVPPGKSSPDFLDDVDIPLVVRDVHLDRSRSLARSPSLGRRPATRPPSDIVFPAAIPAASHRVRPSAVTDASGAAREQTLRVWNDYRR